MIRNDMTELLEPATKAIEKQTKSLESEINKQTKAIEGKFDNELAVLDAQERKLRLTRPEAIEYQDDEEDATDYESIAEATPKASAQSKPKININFDSALKKYEDLYDELEVPRLNTLLKKLFNVEDDENRITDLQTTQEELMEKFTGYTSSFGGTKKGLNKELKTLNNDLKVLNHDLDNLNVLLGSPRYLSDTKETTRKIKEAEQKIVIKKKNIDDIQNEINEIERKKDFIKKYKANLETLVQGISDPDTFQIMRGDGIQNVILFYNNFDELVKRLEVLCGHIFGGNNSIEIRNQANEIIDILFKNKSITKSEYRKLYNKINQ